MCLYASRIDGRGTNKFEESGVTFGWEPIEDMLHRKVQRKKNNQLPRLFRDPWTRLNVKPAKLMQVRLSSVF